MIGNKISCWSVIIIDDIIQLQISFKSLLPSQAFTVLRDVKILVCASKILLMIGWAYMPLYIEY